MVSRSRWPDSEPLHCEKWETAWDSEKNRWEKNTLHYALPEEIRKDLKGAVLTIYYAWQNCRFGEYKADAEKIELSGGKIPTNSDCNFFFEGMPAKYLTPGKWAPAEEKGIFYYKPLPGEKITENKFETTGSDQLLILDGAENIIFEGITFTGNSDKLLINSSQGDEKGHAAIELRNAKNCVFRKCRFINLARWGISIKDGSSGNRIEECEFNNLGSGAIRIAGNETGTEKELATTGNVVESCIIRNGGLRWASCTAILIKHASKTEIRNNRISDFPYTGISCGWSWSYEPSPAYGNIIDGNTVSDLGKAALVKDMGGIYLLGCQPGTVVSNNHIHHIYGQRIVWGIYLDEGSSEMTITGNLVHDCKNEPLHVHYGKNNLIKGNVFIGGPDGACVSVTRGTMDFKNRFTKGDKVFDLQENLCIGNGLPFYMKYLLDIEGKEEFSDSWKGDRNFCVQLDPECKTYFCDDYHIFNKTYREVPAEEFISGEREANSVFRHGALPSVKEVPAAVRPLYEKYLKMQNSNLSGK